MILLSMILPIIEKNDTAVIDSHYRGHPDYDYFSFAQDEFYIYILFLWFGDV